MGGRLNMTLLGNRILVEQKRENKTASGLIIIPEESKEVKKEAAVMLVGDEVTKVKVGDTVIFDAYAGNIFSDTDDSLQTLITEDDVWAVL